MSGGSWSVPQSGLSAARAPGTASVAPFGGRRAQEVRSGAPRQSGAGRTRTSNPLDRVKVGPVAVARFHRVPFAGPVLEPTTPDGGVGTVLGVPGPVLGLDHPKAALGAKTETLCVVVHAYPR